ncbi:MAG: DUF488 family protein [Candidatus Omnitrophota bacterium]
MSLLNSEKNSCFTVGHSNYSVDKLMRLLERHAVNCLADIRSAPYSKYVPQFNKDNISAELKKRNILYVYLGDKLGGIYSDPDLLNADGTVDYARVRSRAEFKDGIEGVIRNIQKGLTIALMCAEKDPLNCHRFRLVSPALLEQGIEVIHILESGETSGHREMEEPVRQNENKENEQLHLFGES